MNNTEKDKLKHDLMNSIVIINSMTRSASTFLNKISEHKDGIEINKKQMEIFLNSMNIIRAQTEKIEDYFHNIFGE